VVLRRADVAQLVKTKVLVEEKLDGANVAIAAPDGKPFEVASRGGTDAMDRGGQIGRLRAWCAERDKTLRDLLAGGGVLYGEWLWRTHGVRYTHLPDFLVVIDLWQPTVGFVDPATRNARVVRAGLAVPPRVFDGVLGSLETLEALLSQSAYADSAAEGLIVRPWAPNGVVRVAKLVAPSWSRVSEDAWRGPPRFNQVAHL
jgi:hypothetical protein